MDAFLKADVEGGALASNGKSQHLKSEVVQNSPWQ